MTTIRSLIIFATLCFTQNSYAHGDHQHEPIAKASVVAIASDVAIDLASRDAGLGFGQLAESWASIEKENIEIYKKGQGYYIASVQNNSEQKTLYVLMSDQGEVYDANFNGTFDGIN